MLRKTILHALLMVAFALPLAARADRYFDKAWSSFVLPHLAWRVTHGPIDWKKQPDVKPWADSLKLELVPKR